MPKPPRITINPPPAVACPRCRAPLTGDPDDAGRDQLWEVEVGDVRDITPGRLLRCRPCGHRYMALRGRPPMRIA
jgi:DNA-directed RNA polymerase subunit RPC12/RpoP